MGITLQIFAEGTVLPVEHRSAETSDASLVGAFEALSGGNLGPLALIYDRCADQMFGLALWRTGNRDDAAEVVQEVFVNLAARARRLPAVRNPRSFLLASTHRAAVDRLRRRRPRSSLEPERLVEAAMRSPEREAEARRTSRCLLRLSAPQREVLYLRYFHDLSFREIGEVTGVPTFTAASRYRLGIRRLRELLGVEA